MGGQEIVRSNYYRIRQGLKLSIAQINIQLKDIAWLNQLSAREILIP
jgi:hypothetical protein